MIIELFIANTHILYATN